MSLIKRLPGVRSARVPGRQVSGRFALVPRKFGSRIVSTLSARVSAGSGCSADPDSFARCPHPGRSPMHWAVASQPSAGTSREHHRFSELSRARIWQQDS